MAADEKREKLAMVWKLKKIGERQEEISREDAWRDSENSYRRGYWDGVHDATTNIDNGATNRQLKHWLWNALSKWRRHNLTESPPPPKIEPWGKIRKRILKRDDYTCHYCGRDATHVDHVIAVSRGGTYDDNNLVAACKNCNLSKGAMLVEEWKP